MNSDDNLFLIHWTPVDSVKPWNSTKMEKGKRKSLYFVVLGYFRGVPVCHFEILGGYQSLYSNFFWNCLLTDWHLELLGGVPVKWTTLYFQVFANTPSSHIMWIFLLNIFNLFVPLIAICIFLDISWSTANMNSLWIFLNCFRKLLGPTMKLTGKINIYF